VSAVLTVAFSVKYPTHRGFERKEYLRYYPSTFSFDTDIHDPSHTLPCHWTLFLYLKTLLQLNVAVPDDSTDIVTG
jgi:hypothetical protein